MGFQRKTLRIPSKIRSNKWRDNTLAWTLAILCWISLGQIWIAHLRRRSSNARISHSYTAHSISSIWTKLERVNMARSRNNSESRIFLWWSCLGWNSHIASLDECRLQFQWWTRRSSQQPWQWGLLLRRFSCRNRVQIPSRQNWFSCTRWGFYKEINLSMLLVHCIASKLVLHQLHQFVDRRGKQVCRK